jgi:hypothetical protein
LVSDRLHDEFRPCDGRHDIRRFTLAKRQLDILTRSDETNSCRHLEEAQGFQFSGAWQGSLR